jgi:hypothetical protein
MFDLEVASLAPLPAPQRNATRPVRLISNSGLQNVRKLRGEIWKAGRLLLQPQSMHRPVDLAQRRAAQPNAHFWKVRGPGEIEKGISSGS